MIDTFEYCAQLLQITSPTRFSIRSDAMFQLNLIVGAFGQPWKRAI